MPYLVCEPCKSFEPSVQRLNVSKLEQLHDLPQRCIQSQIHMIELVRQLQHFGRIGQPLTDVIWLYPKGVEAQVHRLCQCGCITNSRGHFNGLLTDCNGLLPYTSIVQSTGHASQNLSPEHVVSIWQNAEGFI